MGQPSRLLNGTFSLLDIEDVEKFCRAILDRRVARDGGKGLRRDRFDQLLTYLIETAWELSERYEPRCRTCRGGQAWVEEVEYEDDDGVPFSVLEERGPLDPASCETCRGTGRGRPFSYLAYEVLSQRVTDWYRSTIVDTRYGDDCERCDGTGRGDDGGDCVACHGAGKVRRGEEVPLSNVPAFYASADQADGDTLVDPNLPAHALDGLASDDFAGEVIDQLAPLPSHIDRRQLSPRSQWILLEVIRPHVEADLSYEEVARRHGYSRPWVARQIGFVRDELAHLQEAA
jgi:hypothetical protein